MSDNEREYVTPEEGVISTTDGRTYRAYLLPDLDLSRPDQDDDGFLLNMVSNDRSYVNWVGPEAEAWHPTIQDAYNRLPFPAGRHTNVGAWEPVARWLRIFHGMHARVERFGNSLGVAFISRETFDRELLPGSTFDKFADDTVRVYDAWASGEGYGYVIERQALPSYTVEHGAGRTGSALVTFGDEHDARRYADEEASGADVETVPGGWEEVDACFGFYGRDDVMNVLTGELTPRGVTL